jgi:tripartite-type tricarboxylate transporter receptor subunit TctC
LLAPAGTPLDVIAWVHKETVYALRSPAIRERLAEDGLEVVASSPEEFAAAIKSDIAKWTKVVKASGIPLM